MSSSKPPGNGKAPPGTAAPLSGRFIPREELGKFAAWSPHTFGNTQPSEPSDFASSAAPKGQHKVQQDSISKSQAPAAAKDHATAASAQAQREAGYQDGYRDGLVALEQYKHQYAAQVGAQVAAIASEFHQRLESLEQQLAGRLAGIALDLARQVVRSEISQHPELVVGVAEEALSTLLTTARHIAVRLHPDDLALVGSSLGEVLKARGAQLIGDPRTTRGGVLVDSDIAVVDASVESRWARASRIFGNREPWREPMPAASRPIPVASTSTTQASADLNAVPDIAPQGAPVAQESAALPNPTGESNL